MWIYLKDSFLSIVKNLNSPYCLCVRARVAGDIEKVFPYAQVKKGIGTDYLYRASVSLEDVIAALTTEVRENDYISFKGSVTDLNRHDAYYKIWEVTKRELQRLNRFKTAEKRQSKGVFFQVTEDGGITDKGIVDQMLDNDDAITEQLARDGVIKILVVGNKKPDT